MFALSNSNKGWIVESMSTKLGEVPEKIRNPQETTRNENEISIITQEWYQEIIGEMTWKFNRGDSGEIITRTLVSVCFDLSQLALAGRFVSLPVPVHMFLNVFLGSKTVEDLNLLQSFSGRSMRSDMRQHVGALCIEGLRGSLANLGGYHARYFFQYLVKG